MTVLCVVYFALGKYRSVRTPMAVFQNGRDNGPNLHQSYKYTSIIGRRMDVTSKYSCGRKKTGRTLNKNFIRKAASKAYFTPRLYRMPEEKEAFIRSERVAMRPTKRTNNAIERRV